MTEPTNEEIAEALRSIEGLPIGTRLVVLLAADRLSPQVVEADCDGDPDKDPWVGEDGWITWGGGEMPVKCGTLIEVRHRDGEEFVSNAGGRYAVRWDHRSSISDIVAYRVVK